MKPTQTDILPYLDPIFHFCLKRLNSRHDAEDLAGEIVLHVLTGIEKYQITNLEKWVWRIAYNRYARLIDKRNKGKETLHHGIFPDIAADYDFVDDILATQEHAQVFKALHTLSREYRDMMVDYYIEQQPVKAIAQKYGLPETTVKWRLNIGRKKIKTRIGENSMNKVYKRINWETTTCNGSMDSDQYLHSQVTRAICQAAYEQPLTVEEISLKTGLPTMYIEDALPRLIYGDAIAQTGNKYATDFIVLRLCDRQVLQTKFAPMVDSIAAHFTKLFAQQAQAGAVSAMVFYGAHFPMGKLGYIALAETLRDKINQAMKTLDIQMPPFPPRKDGGYGWFVVAELPEDGERPAYASGSNRAQGKGVAIYYDWIGKYFDDRIYHNGGTTWLAANHIVEKFPQGNIPAGILSTDDTLRLLEATLITKDANGFKLNFPVFTQGQLDAFLKRFDKDSADLDVMLAALITEIHSAFKAFVPGRLASQINQYVFVCANAIVGYVAEALINQGALERPDDEKPLTSGVFAVLN
ncbi:MAG: sigma-70 family RNA polymerase sigma factor [Defluviitaleaceae bacterium]|nr:sigma-70 family RNA polymerase sigma factor [Defluviitaleaceae bacterium]